MVVATPLLQISTQAANHFTQLLAPLQTLLLHLVLFYSQQVLARIGRGKGNSVCIVTTLLAILFAPILLLTTAIIIIPACILINTLFLMIPFIVREHVKIIIGLTKLVRIAIGLVVAVSHLPLMVLTSLFVGFIFGFLCYDGDGVYSDIRQNGEMWIVLMKESVNMVRGSIFKFMIKCVTITSLVLLCLETEGIDFMMGSKIFQSLAAPLNLLNNIPWI